MWADNETETDLLGFTIHKDLIRQLVTNEHLLPLTVGVFGDWGCGKSSILRMLRRDLEDEKTYPNTACLYFSGWTFEGYDDAKAALISAVLLALGEHKRFGPKVRGRVVRLLKHVDLMRVVPAILKGGSPFAGAAVGAAATHLGIDPHAALAAIPAAAALGTMIGSESAHGTGSGDGSAQPSEAGGDSSGDGDAARVDWSALLAKDQTSPSVLDIRTFRRDFEELLAETDLHSLVVLVDDLDRCEPSRLIENLEAIRLFLAVPKTAFVIAADERIVRHAVSVRYAAPRLRDERSAQQEPYDLVTDYIEKLIQIPYHLPRLSPSEIETYMTLLFCQLHLTGDDQFDKVRNHCELARKRNLYVTYGAGSVREALDGQLPAELEQRLQWTSAIAPAFTEGLKGNPRQAKRFLNALMLRKQLAEVASLPIRDDVLVKLMLLEYTRRVLFDELYIWQATQEGRPVKLKELEEWVEQHRSATDASLPPPTSVPDGVSPQWAERVGQDWLQLPPILRDVDLRDYFWVARDKLQTVVSGLAMVSPLVRRLFEGLVAANAGEHHTAARSVGDLNQHELSELLRMLSQQIERQTDGRSAVDGVLALIEHDITGAAETLLNALALPPASTIDASIPFELQTLLTVGKLDKRTGWQLLERWRDTHTPVGAAARAALEHLDRPTEGRR